MKKVLALLAVAVLAVSFFGVTSCKPKPIVDQPTPLPTAINTPSGAVALIDDMEDGDNRSSASTDFTGGYWYTFDDLASPNDGDSKVWPMSETAMIKYVYSPYTGHECPVPVPTFQMSDPMIANDVYCFRISGTVTTTFQYGFIGGGFDLNDGTPAADSCTAKTKVTSNLTALGYTKLHFVARNGPNVTGSKTWKVIMGSTGNGFTDANDLPIKTFIAKDFWQAYDLVLTSFAQDPSWCAQANGGGCFPVDNFLLQVTGFKWETTTMPTTADLMVDDVYLVK